MKTKNKKCKQCKITFSRKVWNQVFCSNKCQREWLLKVNLKIKEKKKKQKEEYKSKHPLVERKKECKQCGETFTWRSDKPTRKFCEVKCSSKYGGPKEKDRRKKIKESQQNIDKDNKNLVAVNDVWLTLKHYKEPLKKVKKGNHGFYGALLSTVDGELIQCHICGKLYKSLIFHVKSAHKINTKEYRKKFNLAGSTALVSEVLRNKYKKRTIDWLNKMSKEEKETYFERKRERIKKWYARTKKDGTLHEKMSHPITLETKNKRGTCPDQLLDKIKKVSNQLGHTPSKREFIQVCETQRYMHLIYKTFGSWPNALKMAKLNPKPKTENGGHRKYSDEELLEYLRIFTQEFNKVPTYTDFRRGLLPDYAIYTRRWGGIENARQEAGIYEFIED